MTSSPAQIRWGISIPLRDGTRLCATLYRADMQGKPEPCLFALTPYTAHRNHPRASYFAERGYSFLVVDARGRGDSEGTFRPFIQEAADGFDIVEWIAKQPFCNGRVGMFGGSYEGYVQWATAKEFPPHLVTIAPLAAAAPGIEGNPMRNNIVYPYVMRWLTSVTGRTQQERIFDDQTFWRHRFLEWFLSGRPFCELDRIVGNESSRFQEWLSHPVLDSYWDEFRPTAEEYAKLNLPTLTVTGCYDGDQLGALHYFREHVRNAPADAVDKHYLVIGPWNHRGVISPTPKIGGLEFGAAALVDMMNLLVAWYDWAMRDGRRPEFLRKSIAYYVAGAEAWRYAETLERITSHHKAFFLDSKGAASHLFASGDLTDCVGGGGPDSYIYDPRDSSIAKLELELDDPFTLLRPTFPIDDPTDTTLVVAMEGKQLIYHSLPFSQATELSGFFKLSAWISIDQPDTDFVVTIYEITLSGQSILLTADLMRARYRESLRTEKLIQGSEPLRYDFERFTFISRQLKAGSRLRLVIGPITSVHCQKNHNSGGVVAEETIGDARPVTVRLFHDAAHPSALYVPYGKPVSAGEPTAPLTEFAR